MAFSSATPFIHEEEQRKNQLLTVQLILEMWACWQEQSTTRLDHCTLAREFLLQWREEASRRTHSSSLPSSYKYYWYNSVWQRPAFMVPGLSSPPFCPRDEHPAWCRVLEDHFDNIRDECRPLYNNVRWEQLHKVGAGTHRDGAGAHDGDAVTCGDWREIVLFGAGEDISVARRTRRFLEENCPDAVALARRGGGEIIVSILAPNTRIAPHCASTNLRWTAHLGLEVPKHCTSGHRVAIRVADTWHTWQEGRVLVFDDSYEHEVVNEGNQIRVVLLLRFWHPHLTTTEQRTTVLQQALSWKEADRERRFHPPVPPISTNKS
jgi:hypothetical protein